MSLPSRSLPYRIVQSVYDRTIRPSLPRKIGVYNGVAVRDRALFDVTTVRPEYEGALVDALRANVRTGDRIVVAGGGRGVSATVAAQTSGASGSVVVFEGGGEQCSLVRETAELNCVAERIDVRHAVVARAINVYGEETSEEVVPPDDVPDCDVLELDCEGAELEILRNLEIRPRAVVVETHANLGSPESEVRSALERLGYEVIDRGVEAEEFGIYVLTALRRDE